MRDGRGDWKGEIMNTNNFWQSEIDRCLVMVYKSWNPHSHVGYSLPCADLKDFCSSPDRKVELILTLEVITKTIRNDY